MRTELDCSILRIILLSKEDIQTHNRNHSDHVREPCRMVEKADNPINSGIHAGCVDDALVSMDLSEEERGKLLKVMAKAKVLIC